MGSVPRPGVAVAGMRAPNWGAAVRHGPVGMEVAAPVTVGDTTTITIDATVADSLTYVLPILDPLGRPYPGWPWASPYLTQAIPSGTAPTAASFVSSLFGIMGGDLPASDPWAVGGFDYDNVTGPKSRAEAHDLAPIKSAAVAGGIFSAFELSVSPSASVVNGNFVRLGRVVVALDNDGGTGQPAQISPLDDYTKAPHLIWRVISTGASPDTAMQFAVRLKYLASYCLKELG